MAKKDNLNIKGSFNDVLKASTETGQPKNTLDVDCSEVFSSLDDGKDSFVLYACSSNEFDDLKRNRKYIESQFNERVIFAWRIVKEDKEIEYEFDPFEDYYQVPREAKVSGNKKVLLKF